ncbi:MULTISPECIES: hypothetical protein [unclassified Streptomyces]|uniref:hypothetical protein n=1 Tax=unclassified Streptomyces TaxID=2593676 RepID=UPI002DDB4FE9|nr:hypothetical protein [Streptomyces sp. NBC_01750]WSB02224.1 hypothetical protein OIE54_24820 [Streptomyces sp. NBC_01794]WSD33526.1 hypothetical protein OG966_17405 [Streptomyces sp. NBC_01750]
MTTWTQAALACSIAAAALVIRTALAELRRPGTARQQWRFLTNRRAVMAGALGTAVAVSGLGPGHAIWALLGGVLTAFIVDRLTDRCGDGRE